MLAANDRSADSSDKGVTGTTNSADSCVVPCDKSVTGMRMSADRSADNCDKSVTQMIASNDRSADNCNELSLIPTPPGEGRKS